MNTFIAFLKALLKALVDRLFPDPVPPPPVVVVDDPNHLVATYQKAVIDPDHSQAVAERVDEILSNKSVYEQVEAGSGVPWDVVACIHSLESDLNFSTHLHNGDPLTARTVHVPKGRPVAGNPPFEWFESAIDAMKGEKKPDVWTLQTTLDFLETYNGLGYRLYHPGHLSPYLWAFTTVATPGRYVGDGSWNETSVSQQIGAAAILKGLTQLGLVEFGDDIV